MLPGWSRTDIGGKSADLFEPAVPPRFAVLFLHPLGGELPSDNPVYTTAFAAHGLGVVAPHGGECWWADRVCPAFDPAVTPERYLLDSVVPWTESHWKLRPRSVAVAGIGMGGQGAVRLGLKHPDRFPVVASVAGAFDHHERYGRGTPLDAMYPSREACRRDTAVLHVDPHHWPPQIWFACDPMDAEWFRGNDRLHEKLAAVGVPHVIDFDTTRGGHGWAYFDAMAGPMAAFVADGLAKEARRLI